MELENIRIFTDVMKYGSFAAAARQRNVDPSSVSRSISGLEAELGFRLFQRSTRKLAPTEAGKLYFSRVENLVSEFDQAGEQAQDLINQPAGNLRVAACTSFGQRILAPLLPKLRARFPDLAIELMLADHQIDIIEDEIDLAIRFGPRPQGDFIASQLTPRRFQVCASPSYVAEHGHPNSPEELQDLDCLLFPMAGYRRAWHFRKDGGTEFEVPVSGQLLISHGLTMTACAVAGLGPAILPDWLCNKELEQGSLVDLFPDYECAAVEFDTAAWLLYPSREYVPLKLRVFIDFLREEVTGYS